MGRSVVSKKKPTRSTLDPKAIDISTDSKLENWIKKSDVKNNVEWVVLLGTGDLEAIDPQLLRDSAGDHVYRVFHTVDKLGRVSEQHGNIRVYHNRFVRKDCVVNLPKNIQEKLNSWLKSAQEAVYETDPTTGLSFPVLKLNPVNIQVPGWQRLTKKEYDAKRKQAIKHTADNIMKMFFK